MVSFGSSASKATNNWFRPEEEELVRYWGRLCGLFILSALFGMVSAADA